MTDAPKRVWLKLRGVPKIYDEPCADMPLLEPYVHADIHEATVAENKRLREAIAEWGILMVNLQDVISKAPLEDNK